MFWVIKSILTTVFLCIFAFSFFGSSHVEIDNSFFCIAFAISIFIMLISHLLFKYTMPESYVKYKTWHNTTSVYITNITMLPLLGYLVFFAFGLNYLNQYNVSNPVETIKTQVINKYTIYGNTIDHYTNFYISPWQTLTLSSDTLYNMLNINDKATVKIQKGRLGKYFALELKVQKNGYILLL